MNQIDQAFYEERLKDAHAVLSATLPHAGERFAETLRIILADVVDASRFGDYAAAQAAAQQYQQKIQLALPLQLSVMFLKTQQ